MVGIGVTNDSTEQIVTLYRSVGRSMRVADPADWAEGLTMPQVRVLFLLGRSGTLSVGSVADSLGITQPSATETIDRLVRAGYVARVPCTNDRRVVRTALTPAGKELIDRPWEARRAVLAGALARATDEQRALIALGLQTLDAVMTHASAGAEGPVKSPSDAAGHDR